MTQQLVTVSQYAAMAGLNKGTVSRWVARGVIQNHGIEGKPLIDPAQADAARLATVDRAKVPGLLLSGGELPVARQAAETVGSGPGGAGAAGAGATGAEATYTAARTVYALEQARTAKLKRQRAEGALLGRQEAVEAMTTIGIEVQRFLEQRVRDMADRLVGLDDADRIAAIVREEDRRLLDLMVTGFRRLADAEGETDDEEEGEDDAT